MLKKPFLLWSVAAILAIAGAIQIAPFLFPAPISKEAPLDELISANLPGWKMQELELGQTEEVRNAVVGTLRFDDHVSRLYSQGDTQVGVYIAYWQPGTMPVRKVGVHTPDTCWVQNGWVRAERESHVNKMVAGSPIKPAEYGVFDFAGTRQFVLFWHIVGDRLHTYDQQGMHSMTAALTDTLQYGLNQRQEQFFIRISSNRPFDEVWNESGFQQLMSEVAALGLIPTLEEEKPLATAQL